jgi:L-arabinose isomerase
MANKTDLKIGLFGIGLEAYWEQFDGLKTRLESYISIVQQKLEGFDAEIVNLGLIDTPEKAFEAGKDFRKADVDLIFYTLLPTHYLQLFCLLCSVQKCR